MGDFIFGQKSRGTDRISGNKYIKIIHFLRYFVHRFSLKVVIDKQLFQTIMRAIETNNAMTRIRSDRFYISRELLSGARQ